VICCHFYRNPFSGVAVFTVAFFTIAFFTRCPFYRCRFYWLPNLPFPFFPWSFLPWSFLPLSFLPFTPMLSFGNPLYALCRDVKWTSINQYSSVKAVIDYHSK